MDMSMYRWREIGNAPDQPGIYAWYYTPQITDFDLDRVVAEVTRSKAESDLAAASQAVRVFLYETVFRYFQEQPYVSLLHGPLKPRYEGLLEHRPSLSERLVERLVDDPRRLRTIKRVLESSVPGFASPMYIGMSDKLRSRLAQHKALIERYGDSTSAALRGEATTGEGDRRDYSFAREVKARSIPPSRLFVVVHVIADAGDEYVDIENILNRIHYPLLGRN